MEVTLSGIIHFSIIALVKLEIHFGSALISVSDVQPLKALEPMEVTLFPMVTEVSDLQSEKA